MEFRRRTGIHTAQRGQAATDPEVRKEPSSFGCGLPALRCIAELHSAGRRIGPSVELSRRLAECNSAIRQSITLRYEVALNT